jgi:hypothetical protein
MAASPPARPPGLLVLQLDGVAEPILRRALDEGRMPVIRGWLAGGSHVILPWQCGLPSQTSGSQSGIFYGRNLFPGFRFFDKERARLFVSNQPADAAEMDRLAATGKGLLREGSSLVNLLAGDAPRSALTMSTLGRAAFGETFSTDIYFQLFNPYVVWWTLVGIIREIARELGQAWRARLANVHPRIRRGGSYPFLRAAANVVLRDLSLEMLRRELASGVPVTYCTFVGYDVVAHHAGPSRPEAMAVLGELDAVVGRIASLARGAPRAYALVLLSDHGQTRSVPFRQIFGLSLEEVVSGLADGRRVAGSRGDGETWGYLNALLQEAVQGQRRSARAARRFLRPRTRGGVVEIGPERDRRRRGRSSPLVVCDSGNLALVYLADEPGRATLERIEERYPGLVGGLADHDGVGFVLCRSKTRGPVVVGRHGLRHLADGNVEGEDPLIPYGPHAAQHLRAIDELPQVGDLVVNGRYDASRFEAISFEELVGVHGGLGGAQNEAFLVVPASWPDTSEPLVGAASLNSYLRGHLPGPPLQSDA